MIVEHNYKQKKVCAIHRHPTPLLILNFSGSPQCSEKRRKIVDLSGIIFRIFSYMEKNSFKKKMISQFMKKT
jgi:hypothetical protein